MHRREDQTVRPRCTGRAQRTSERRWGIPPEQGLGKIIWVFEGLKQGKKEGRRGTLAKGKRVLGGEDMTMVRTDR